MTVARWVARAVGWLFVAVIGYHAVLAAIEAVQEARDGNWAHAAALAGIALVATAIVTVAVVAATRSRTRAR